MHSSDFEGLASSWEALRAAASASASAVCTAAFSAMTAGLVGSGGGLLDFLDFLGVVASSEGASMVTVVASGSSIFLFSSSIFLSVWLVSLVVALEVSRRGWTIGAVGSHR